MAIKNLPKKPQHSVVGASSAHIWMNCPGSVRLAKDLPRQESSHAREGTLAHMLAEKHLNYIRRKGKRVPIEEYYKIYEPIAASKYGKGKITDEMLQASQMYADVIMDDMKPGMTLRIEQKFNLEFIHPDAFGTNDACLEEPFGTLRIYDFKYGAGMPVEVEHNEQLMYYALGAAQDNDFDNIEMVIVQPRASHPEGPIRRWRMSAEDLFLWGEKILAPAIEKVFTEGAPLKSGSWCRCFCSAMAVCPELVNVATELAQLEFNDVTSQTLPTLPSAEALTLNQVAKVLDFTDILNSWSKEIFQYALNQAENGVKIPGYKLVNKHSRRRWKDAETTKDALGSYGSDIYSPPSLLSPAQMEKVVRNKSELKELWEKPISGTTLAREEDKRPELRPSIETDFKPIK